MDIQKLTYEFYFNQVDNFIGLDISKNNTGWVRKLNGVVEWGTFVSYAGKADTSEELTAMRMAFREFVINLFGDTTYDYVFIEDVIGGENFKTNKKLYTLNVVVDDLVALGNVKAKEIVRLDNNSWKKTVKMLANYKATILKEDDKTAIRACAKNLGFESAYDVRDDITDVICMSVAGIHIAKFSDALPVAKKVSKRKINIKSGFEIKQFYTEEEAYDYLDTLNRKFKDIVVVECLDRRRNLEYIFRETVEELGVDCGFIFEVPVNKIGALVLQYDINVDAEFVYLCVYKKSTRKG